MNNLDNSKMRVSLAMFAPVELERLKFSKQLGVNDIIIWGNTLRRPPILGQEKAQDYEISYEEFKELKTTIENEGLNLFGIENFPFHFYDKIFWNLDGKEEQLEHFKNNIRNMAKAGIYNFGYNWIPYGVKRTSYSYPIRGGAKAISYDHELMKNEPLYYGRDYTEEEFWDNYTYFISNILPVCEKCGVTISVHPNDPPVDKIGGVPHLFKSVESYIKAFNIYPSDNHKITLCLGNLTEMGGDLYEKIRYFGERNKIHYVHFQSVSGSIPNFHEEFIDTGDFDPYLIIKTLKEVNFNSVMIPGHVPQIEGDIEWRTQESNTYTSYHHPMGGYRSRAYTIGYLRALINAINHQED